MPAFTAVDASVATELADLRVRGDYFSEEEYRQVSGDDTVPYKADRNEILRAQEEAIDRLESYSRSAWRPKFVTDTFHTVRPVFSLKRYPIQQVLSLTVDGYPWAVDSDFIFDLESGVARQVGWAAGDPYWDSPVYVQISYVYGFTEVPWTIKRPMIEACQTLIEGWAGESKVPRNTSRYSTERSSFELRKDRGLIRPWPYDERASQDIRAYWENYRPKTYITT